MAPDTPTDPAGLRPDAARALFREGLTVATSGWSAGWTQANLIAVPRDLAEDVRLFAERNPRSCPVLGSTGVGQVGCAIFDGDLRTDLPGYRVYEHGELVAEVSDVRDVWRDDFVAFLIGCSFTFEAALLEAGVLVRHLEVGSNVPMYRTTVDCTAAGAVSGPLVVSMRPVPADQVDTAVRVTGRYPAVHGAPVHVGDPAELGITDLATPDFGDPVPVHPGEVALFWACGVTPQAAIMESRPPFAIGHAPGMMAVTDVQDSHYLDLEVDALREG